MHNSQVKSLKQTLEEYNVDPFSDGPVVHKTTGKELDQDIVTDLLNAENIGEERYKEFVDQRHISGKSSFFDTISKVKLKTGVVKKLSDPQKLYRFSRKTDKHLESL